MLNPKAVTEQTTFEAKKARLIEIFEGLLQSFENDITSGIEEGTYDKDDNVENLALIEEAHKEIEAFKNYMPSIYLYIEGGNLQGISGTETIDVELFDKDNYDQSQELNEETNKIENTYHYDMDEWDEMIKDKTEKKEVKGIY